MISWRKSTTLSLTSALITKVSKINYWRFFTTKEYKMTTSMIGQFQTLREIKTSGPQDATDNTCLLRLLRIFIRKFNTNCNKLTILKKSSSVQIMFYLTFWLGGVEASHESSSNSFFEGGSVSNQASKKGSKLSDVNVDSLIDGFRNLEIIED